MDAIDKLQLTAQLQNEICALNHGPTEEEEVQAVDYVVLPMGNVETGEQLEELTIPVCADCAESLQEDEWILIYCIHCCESQWILRELSKMDYPKDKHIVLTDGCPKCTYKTDKVFVR